MSRPICSKCQRPSKVCLCAFIEPIDNQVEVGILQHPSELKQIKGTALIAKLSLRRCQLWVGEQLSDAPGLIEWLKGDEPVFLLYPSIESQQLPVEVLNIDSISEQYPGKFKVLVLDGTWRKTYKMMQLNTELRALKRVELMPTMPSLYEIRKQKDDFSLSTVEAIFTLLSQLEDNAEKFHPLLKAFDAMQRQQMAFRKPLLR